MRLQPEEVGLRRTRGQRSSADPGLRREEVAELADISVAYYTFIERGRDVRPSKEVLRSIGTGAEPHRRRATTAAGPAHR